MADKKEFWKFDRETCPTCKRTRWVKKRRPDTKCLVCKGPVEQPRTGRIRLVCEKKECQLTRKYQRENRKVRKRRST